MPPASSSTSARVAGNLFLFFFFEDFFVVFVRIFWFRLFDLATKSDELAEPAIRVLRALAVGAETRAVFAAARVEVEERSLAAAIEEVAHHVAALVRVIETERVRDLVRGDCAQV